MCFAPVCALVWKNDDLVVAIDNFSLLGWQIFFDSLVILEQNFAKDTNIAAACLLPWFIIFIQERASVKALIGVLPTRLLLAWSFRICLNHIY